MFLQQPTPLVGIDLDGVGRARACVCRSGGSIPCALHLFPCDFPLSPGGRGRARRRVLPVFSNKARRRRLLFDSKLMLRSERLSARRGLFAPNCPPHQKKTLPPPPPLPGAPLRLGFKTPKFSSAPPPPPPPQPHLRCSSASLMTCKALAAAALPSPPSPSSPLQLHSGLHDNTLWKGETAPPPPPSRSSQNSERPPHHHSAAVAKLLSRRVCHANVAPGRSSIPPTPHLPPTPTPLECVPRRLCLWWEVK